MMSTIVEIENYNPDDKTYEWKAALNLIQTNNLL